MPRFSFGTKHHKSPSPSSSKTPSSSLSDKDRTASTSTNTSSDSSSISGSGASGSNMSDSSKKQKPQHQHQHHHHTRRSLRNSTMNDSFASASLAASARSLPPKSSTSASLSSPSTGTGAGKTKPSQTKGGTTRTRTGTRTRKKKKNGSTSTSTSVVKSRRYGIQIPIPTTANENGVGSGGGGADKDMNDLTNHDILMNGGSAEGDGDGFFADDAAYWEAAKQAATQDTPVAGAKKSNANADGSSEGTRTEDEDEGEHDKAKKRKEAELKKLEQKAALRRAKRAELKKQHDYSHLLQTPDLNGNGTGAGSVHMNGNGTAAIGMGMTNGNAHNNDNDDDSQTSFVSGSFVKKALTAAARAASSQRGVLPSPSDISHASPIPPTPATTATNTNTRIIRSTRSNDDNDDASARSSINGDMNTNALLQNIPLSSSKSISDADVDAAITPISALKRIRIFGNDDDDDDDEQMSTEHTHGHNGGAANSTRNDENLIHHAHADIDIDHAGSHDDGDLDDDHVDHVRRMNMKDIIHETSRPLSPLVEDEEEAFSALHVPLSSPLHEDANIGDSVGGVNLDVDDHVDDHVGVAKEDIRKAVALEDNIESVIGQSEGLEIGASSVGDDRSSAMDVDGDVGGNRDGDGNDADVSGVDIQGQGQGQEQEPDKEGQDVGQKEHRTGEEDHQQEQYDDGEGWDDDIGVGFELASDQDQSQDQDLSQSQEEEQQREKPEKDQELRPLDEQEPPSDDQTESEPSLSRKRDNDSREDDDNDIDMDLDNDKSDNGEEEELQQKVRRTPTRKRPLQQQQQQQQEEEPSFDQGEGYHSGSAGSPTHEERTPKSSTRRNKRYGRLLKEVPEDPEAEPEPESSDGDQETPAEKLPKKKKTKKRSRKRVSISTPEATTYGGVSSVRMYQDGNRDYETIPLEEFEGDEGDDTERNGVRRSRRRRFKPVQFWKNERPLYEANNFTGRQAEIYGNMPMVTGVIKAQPTPYKRKVIRRKKRDDDDSDGDGESDKEKKDKETARNKKKTDPKATVEQEQEEVFDSHKLRKKYKFQDGDSAPIWLESEGRAVTEKIVHFRERIKLHDLPQVKKRKKSESKVVARASQTFNVAARGSMPGYISGCMEIPPTGIKDDEGVGLCTQLFMVGQCQPKSLELAIADPDVNEGNWSSKMARRFLLSAGDQFHIPAGNVYRLENHSKTTASSLTWTLMRPTEE